MVSRLANMHIQVGGYFAAPWPGKSSRQNHCNGQQRNPDKTHGIIGNKSGLQPARIALPPKQQRRSRNDPPGNTNTR